MFCVFKTGLAVVDNGAIVKLDDESSTSSECDPFARLVGGGVRASDFEPNEDPPPPLDLDFERSPT